MSGFLSEMEVGLMKGVLFYMVRGGVFVEMYDVKVL